MKKLEEFKQLGMYGVHFFYGEGIGCDDSDVPPEERNIVLIGNPVGCLGETRVMFKGKLKELDTFDFKTKPKVISNPPNECEYDKGGYFIWGTEESVKHILEHPIFGSWK